MARSRRNPGTGPEERLYITSLYFRLFDGRAQISNQLASCNIEGVDVTWARLRSLAQQFFRWCLETTPCVFLPDHSSIVTRQPGRVGSKYEPCFACRAPRTRQLQGFIPGRAPRYSGTVPHLASVCTDTESRHRGRHHLDTKPNAIPKGGSDSGVGCPGPPCGVDLRQQARPCQPIVKTQPARAVAFASEPDAACHGSDKSFRNFRENYAGAGGQQNKVSLVVGATELYLSPGTWQAKLHNRQSRICRPQWQKPPRVVRGLFDVSSIWGKARC